VGEDQGERAVLKIGKLRAASVHQEVGVEEAFAKIEVSGGKAVRAPEVPTAVQIKMEDMAATGDPRRGPVFRPSFYLRS